MSAKRIEVGDVVIYTPHEGEELPNGAETCPAIIVRTWGPDMANLRLLTDGEPPAPVSASLSFDALERVALDVTAEREREARKAEAAPATATAETASAASPIAGPTQSQASTGSIPVVVNAPRFSEWRTSVRRGEGPHTFRTR